MQKNEKTLLLISAIVGSIYIFIMVLYVAILLAETGFFKVLFGILAAGMILPILVLITIGVTFTWVAYAIKEKWALIVSIIIFAISIFFSFLYFYVSIICLVLNIIVYFRISKNEKTALATEKLVNENGQATTEENVVEKTTKVK